MTFLIIGSLSTEEEAKEIQYIAKTAIVRNRIKELARSIQ